MGAYTGTNRQCEDLISIFFRFLGNRTKSETNDIPREK
jgi:hypothetical protein